MPNLRRNITGLCILSVLFCAGTVLAGTNLPHRFSTPALDQGLVQLTNIVDGRAWSVWAYRSGAEYDIAISVRGLDGSWSEPRFLGQSNGRNEIQPALTVDPSGTVYLAYAVRETGKIMVSSVLAGSAVWSEPVSVVLEPGRHLAPRILAVGDRLVIAYRTGANVGMALLQLRLPMGLGIQDGPDGFPLPASGEDNGFKQ